MLDNTEVHLKKHGNTLVMLRNPLEHIAINHGIDPVYPNNRTLHSCKRSISYHSSNPVITMNPHWFKWCNAMYYKEEGQWESLITFEQLVKLSNDL